MTTSEVIPMDLTLAFNIAITLVSFLGGWLLKSLFERIRSLEIADINMAKEFSDIRVLLPSAYVRRDDFKELGDNIFSALRRIEDKLDTKVDKE